MDAKNELSGVNDQLKQEILSLKEAIEAHLSVEEAEHERSDALVKGHTQLRDTITRMELEMGQVRDAREASEEAARRAKRKLKKAEKRLAREHAAAQVPHGIGHLIS